MSKSKNNGKPKHAKPNRKGRNDTEQYFKLTYQMAKSRAWRFLSGAALKVFIELRCRYNGGNNGELILSLDEAAEILKLGKATVSRALVELQEKGFIVKTKQGHWYGRMASEFATTDKSLDGAIPTNAWREWRPSRKQSLGSQVEHNHHQYAPTQNRRE